MAAMASLERQSELRDLVDDVLEHALVRRASVGEVLKDLLPRVAQFLGVAGAYVETYAEDLALHIFSSGEPLPDPSVLLLTGEQKRERVARSAGTAFVIAQPLDVAGAWFGSVGLICAKEAAEEELRVDLATLLNTVCEVLDNYLFTIRAAREKHQLMMELGDALRHRVFADGLREAVRVLCKAAPVHKIALVYVAEDQAAQTVQAAVYEDGTSVLETMSVQGPRTDKVRKLAGAYLSGESQELFKELGFTEYQEEVLINGITNSVIVGKVIVTSKTGEFSTYDRELLSGFAGFVRQRIVDFNKEWRSLAFSFRPDDVARLLGSDSYEQRYLAPREEVVGILYVDIAGFTRLSEQVLKTPSAVAALVEAWSHDAVDIVWKYGGVFDKMVGDCIIALFGPPFYDMPEAERLARALQCAKEIGEMTRALPTREEFRHLAEVGVDVSTGVNLAPLFVGTFGPNANFTGFSSGMNNTARLQGCAGKGEILVMEEAIGKLADASAFRFGDVKTAQVKNVADPLRFRPLL